MPAEILIADDGSTSETAELIERFQPLLPVPLIHVWHEDDGFKKGMILNKTMAIAQGEYLVVLDGDIFVHPDFIQDHMTLAAVGQFVSGSRMKLSDTQSEVIIRLPFPKVSLLQRMFTPNAYHVPFLMRVVSPHYKRNDLRRTLKGGNMGVWRHDILNVNGYDEDFHGWGYEDTDLGERLRNSGLRMINLKWGGVGYHLWHPEANRDGAKENLARVLQTRNSHRVRCMNGIDKYL